MGLSRAPRRSARVRRNLAAGCLLRNRQDGDWAVDEARAEAILETIEGINQRRDCSDFYLVGLLGMLYRFGDDPLSQTNSEQPLEECVLNFKYWNDEPGRMRCGTGRKTTDSLSRLRNPGRTALSRQVFTNTGQTGSGTGKRASDWRWSGCTSGARRISEWDSNCYFEEDLLALSHLADLAENGEVCELAAVVMDKMLFTIALNSYKGVFGSTHGRTYAPHDQGRPPGGDVGHHPLDVGHGRLQPSHMGTGQPGLLWRSTRCHC